MNALGELDYQDFKKPVEEFLQDYKADQERKKQRKAADLSAGESKPADAFEEERDEDDEDIEDEAEEVVEQEEDEQDTSMNNTGDEEE